MRERPVRHHCFQAGQFGRIPTPARDFANEIDKFRCHGKAGKIKPNDVIVRSDSELLVKQMTGAYKVKNDGLRELFLEAKELARQIPRFSIEHVRRGEGITVGRDP